MAAKIDAQEAIVSKIAGTHAAMEAMIARIAEHVQRQSVFNQSAKKSIACLENQVRIHQDNFDQVVRILQKHEQHIIRNGVASQEMAQCINSLAIDSEKNRSWIGAMMNESQA